MDDTSMSMDLDDLRKKLTIDTVAMVNVETNGVLGNLHEMKSFANEHELFFIEDSASALVQNYNGTNAGRFGNIGVYSFANTKVLDSGEGGVIVTDHQAIYKRVKSLRYSKDYSSVYPLSMNFNMSPYLADRILTQFSSIHSLSADRERVHNLYKENGLNIFEFESVTNRYQYIMYRSQVARKISDKLKKLKIGHRYKHYTVVGDYPIANKIKSEVIDLPTFYGISDLQIQTICNVIKGVERDNL
jgi:dTDP-4-amino-4,6-dideoxygalactose transaminase